MDAVKLFDCGLRRQEIDAIIPAMQEGRLASGPHVQELEAALGRYLGVENVVTTSDMTHALAIALKLANVGPGDEVLTLAFNCLSSNSAISAVGARAVWVDIDEKTAQMTVANCAKALTAKTKALIAYHVSGYPSPARDLKKFCEAHQIIFIEDANNALGAFSQADLVGIIGDYGVFSFYANRQLNGIEGGALVCPSATQAQRAKRIRRFGIDTPSFRDGDGEINRESDIQEFGFSAALNNINAGLACAGLKTLEQRLALNRRNASLLKERLNLLDGVEVVSWGLEDRPVFWTFLVLLRQRDEVMRLLKKAGIQCSKLHQTNHIYSVFEPCIRSLPNTDQFADQVLALPCGWWLDESDIARICKALESAVVSAGKTRV